MVTGGKTFALHPHYKMSQQKANMNLFEIKYVTGSGIFCVCRGLCG